MGSRSKGRYYADGFMCGRFKGPREVKWPKPPKKMVLPLKKGNLNNVNLAAKVRKPEKKDRAGQEGGRPGGRRSRAGDA